MELQSQHLELVFVTSTLTPAAATGWVFTTTPALPPRPVGTGSAPVRLQLAVIGA